jgi:uncharacterized membrane protein YdbT with pleckstrin-like domain
MGYVENNLSANEKVLAKGKIHWFVFAPSIVFFLIGLSLTGEPKIAPIGAIVIIAAIYLFLKALLAVISTELAITTKRVIAKFGFIRRKTIEMNHTKVESFNVDQSIFGRIFGFGTLTINGTGGVRTPMPSISKPLEFRRIATEQIENIQA